MSGLAADLHEYGIWDFYRKSAQTGQSAPGHAPEYSCRQEFVLTICADGCAAGLTNFRRGWASRVWTDTHLTYMTNITLNTEFVVPPHGAW
jgi:hypothetical protein